MKYKYRAYVSFEFTRTSADIAANATPGRPGLDEVSTMDDILEEFWDDDTDLRNNTHVELVAEVKIKTDFASSFRVGQLIKRAREQNVKIVITDVWRDRSTERYVTEWSGEPDTVRSLILDEGFDPEEIFRE